MKERLYIDVDGVLLAGAGLSLGAKEFILLVVRNFDCYWLTIHCKGDAAPVLRYLRPYVDDETFEALVKIRPTDWDIFKTDALDASAPNWLWLDDAPLATELEWLRNNDREASWIRIDTNTEPHALAEFTGAL